MKTSDNMSTQRIYTETRGGDHQTKNQNQTSSQFISRVNMPKLTAKQEAFIQSYIETNNATEAAKRAWYSAKTAWVIWDENLKKPYIKEEIEKRKSKLAEKHHFTVAELFEWRKHLVKDCKKNWDRTNLKESYKELGKLIWAYEKDNSQKRPELNIFSILDEIQDGETAWRDQKEAVW